MRKDSFLTRVFSQVVVNVATAVLLFLMAAAFKTQVQEVFDTIFARDAPLIDTYPIHCAAEPHSANPERSEVSVDFFIINASGSTYTAFDLKLLLDKANPDDSRELSPRIVLEYRAHATVEFLSDETRAFNAGKGDVRVSIDRENRITINIERIEARAVLKVVLRMGDLYFVDPNLNRGMLGATQIVNQNVLGSCFSYGVRAS